MRLAVLGASGVAGRSFLPRAQAAGHSVVPGRADILDLDAVRAFVEGSDAVVNLATSIPRPGGRGDWAQNDRIRRAGTANVIAACGRMGVRTLVQQSVAMLHCVADDRPQTEDDPLAGDGVLASAVDMEAQLREAALDWRVVRGALFRGPGTFREETWREEVRQAEFRVPGDGRNWVSLIHVDDFAEAVLAVLERGAPREAYIAADDAPLRLGDLYAAVAASEGLSAPPPGGPVRLRSFRVSNQKLRALGWVPAYPRLRLDRP